LSRHVTWGRFGSVLWSHFTFSSPKIFSTLSFVIGIGIGIVVSRNVVTLIHSLCSGRNEMCFFLRQWEEDLFTYNSWHTYLLSSSKFRKRLETAQLFFDWNHASQGSQSQLWVPHHESYLDRASIRTEYCSYPDYNDLYLFWQPDRTDLAVLIQIYLCTQNST